MIFLVRIETKGDWYGCIHGPLRFALAKTGGRGGFKGTGHDRFILNGASASSNASIEHSTIYASDALTREYRQSPIWKQACEKREHQLETVLCKQTIYECPYQRPHVKKDMVRLRETIKPATKEGEFDA